MTQLTTSLERLQEIENERQEVLNNPQFYKWMQELKVASMYVDRQLIHNAQYAMQEWDSSRFRVPDIKDQCM